MIILYERFANKENIEAKLAQFSLDESEKEHLLDLLAKIYQQYLLNAILDQLENEDQKMFLEKFYFGQEAEVINFLANKIEKLNETMDRLVSELEIEIFTKLEKGELS